MGSITACSPSGSTAGCGWNGKYDDIAGIDYRFTVSPMAGYYLIKNTNMTLAVEAGPSLIYQQSARGDIRMAIGPLVWRSVLSIN